MELHPSSRSARDVGEWAMLPTQDQRTADEAGDGPAPPPVQAGQSRSTICQICAGVVPIHDQEKCPLCGIVGHAIHMRRHVRICRRRPRNLFASMHRAMFEGSRRYSVQFRRARRPQRSGWGYNSPSAREWLYRVAIFPGEPIFLCDATVVDGFVPFSFSESGGPVFHVAAEDVFWPIGSLHRWAPLTDRHWFSHSWPLDISKFWIKVVQGICFDDLPLSEQRLFQEAVGPDAGSIFYKLTKGLERYTYASLELGSPILEDVHVSLGYFIPVEEITMDKLTDALEITLRFWIETPRLERPSVVPNYVPVQRTLAEESGYDVYRLMRIVDLSQDRLETIMRSDQVRYHGVASSSADETEEEIIRKAHSSQRQRRQFHASRLPHVPDLLPGQPITMQTPAAGLGGITNSPHLVDLLHYLRDRLLHASALYKHDSEGNLVTPRLTSPARWHCSRRDSWMPVRVLEQGAGESAEQRPPLLQLEDDTVQGERTG